MGLLINGLTPQHITTDNTGNGDNDSSNNMLYYRCRDRYNALV